VIELNGTDKAALYKLKKQNQNPQQQQKKPQKACQVFNWPACCALLLLFHVTQLAFTSNFLSMIL